MAQKAWSLGTSSKTKRSVKPLRGKPGDMSLGLFSFRAYYGGMATVVGASGVMSLPRRRTVFGLFVGFVLVFLV